MKSVTLFTNAMLVLFVLLLTCNIIEAQTKSSTQVIIEVTIDQSTSDDDFENIKDMFSEYGIEASFSNIKRNENDEITGISITLSSENGQQTSSSFSSNRPIKSMTFGSENGSLYIGNSKGNASMFGFFNKNRSSLPFDMDSIFGSKSRIFKFDDFFNGNSSKLLFDSDSLDIDALRKKFMQNFSFGSNNSMLSDNDNNQRFRFVDNPDKDTLIIIDGEISDFKTLDNLAKANKLSDVDVLKPETAMSLYGDKAKDGAIIAITEK